MKVLLIEDDPRVSAFIRKGLEEQEYSVTAAYDGPGGKKLALEQHFDLIILDILLPHEDGLRVCKSIRRENREVPILMLTALGTAHDTIARLDTGADDYIVKPFNFKELLARIRALTRRRAEPSDGKSYKVADLELIPDAHIVRRVG